MSTSVNSTLHAISVDVEEYYHATNLEPAIPPARWHSTSSRVEFSTNRTLELFADAGIRGTFFTLGCVARRHPALIREIVAAGHELASHGYGHRLVYNQSPRAFYRDIRKAKLLLEDLSGVRVIGYRAPNFSIIEGYEWAYDQLLAAGYRYDSSRYPIRHPRYGNRNNPLTPAIIKRGAREIIVSPLAVLEIFGLRVPIAGGAYWRHFPAWFIEQALMKAKEKLPLNCYLHPWEFDAEQPIVDSLPALTKLRHYGGIRTLDRKLLRFAKVVNFGRIIDSLRQQFPGKFSDDY